MNGEYGWRGSVKKFTWCSYKYAFSIDNSTYKVSGAILVVNSNKDTNEQVRRCQIFQICTCKEKKEVVPWKPISIEINFNEWGLDVIVYINPNSSNQCMPCFIDKRKQYDNLVLRTTFLGFV